MIFNIVLYMVDLLTWSIIIIADVFSILLGFYSADRFIRAYLDKRDLIKYQGYLINVFLLMILFPLLITFGGMKLADSYGGKYTQIGISVQTNDLRGVNNKIYFDSKEFHFEPNEKREIDLNIINDLQVTEDFSIDIYCLDEKQKCNKAINTLIPNENEFNIDPTMTFKLPISINIKDDTPSGKYNFNISIKDESNSIYDSIPLTISVR